MSEPVVADLDAAIEFLHHQNAYRLCYIHGPEGILIGLAQELG